MRPTVSTTIPHSLPTFYPVLTDGYICAQLVVADHSNHTACRLDMSFRIHVRIPCFAGGEKLLCRSSRPERGEGIIETQRSNHSEACCSRPVPNQATHARTRNSIAVSSASYSRRKFPSRDPTSSYRTTTSAGPRDRPSACMQSVLLIACCGSDSQSAGSGERPAQPAGAAPPANADPHAASSSRHAVSSHMEGSGSHDGLAAGAVRDGRAASG
eukprot:COSAG01_NODE_3893_length_5577_cov_3.387550_3_plen_214_part_00